jgi:hypothetical protein
LSASEVAPPLIYLKPSRHNGNDPTEAKFLAGDGKQTHGKASSGMQAYIAYLIGSDGRAKRRVDLLCADEADAHERARQLVSGDMAKLWQHYHLIATFVPRLPIQ